MDDSQVKALAWLALRKQLEQVRRSIGEQDAKRVVEHAELWFRDRERRAEFLAFWWSSYSRLIDRGDDSDSAFTSAIQNARRSVSRGSRFLESDYCGSIDRESPELSELRSPRRPKIQACACGTSLDVNRHCRHCGTCATGSLGNPGAAFVDCLDPLPLRQLADKIDGGPSRELWIDRGGTLPAGTTDDLTAAVCDLFSIH